MGKSNAKNGKSTKFEFRKRRVFSEAFKREKVAEITSGKITVLELSRLWDARPWAIYLRIYKYSPDHQKGTTMVVQKDSEATKVKTLLARIAELERIVGQKQLAIDFQDKPIEIASQKLSVGLKKIQPQTVEFYRQNLAEHPHSMNRIYSHCGISKQEHHQSLQRQRTCQQQERVVVGLMLQLREIHPGMGLRTMYEHHQPESVGRGAFISIGLKYGFRTKVFRNKTRTTFSSPHSRYRNLLTDKTLDGTDQLWTSDITARAASVLRSQRPVLLHRPDSGRVFAAHHWPFGGRQHEGRQQHPGLEDGLSCQEDDCFPPRAHPPL